ncbi:MAG: hypothetical protein A3C47_04705 [Omnitrophica bacterium RIFCSPHIGHO2_02_FULL_51_18]|nr:MAG: hypothetical protein A3C47_04705 [Omnitrophica bacterium RIFCSPHIGHO2_02_FULL_51_18]
MEFLSSGPLASGWATLALAAVLFGALRLGAFLLKPLGIPAAELSPLEEKLFSLALGITALSLLVLLLGLAGGLNDVVLWTVLVGCVFLRGPANRLERFHFTVVERFLLVVGGGILFLSWLQALAPPTGNDALAYHLAHPREFLLKGGISHLELTRESLWPYQTEMLFTLGLLLQGTILAQLMHWLFFGLTAVLIFSLGKRFYGQRAGLLSALVFLLTPAAFAQSGQAYVDLSLAFFMLAAAYALVLRGTLGETPSALLAGLMCGAALGTKYLALGPAAILWALLLFERRGFKPVFIFMLSALAVSAVWYARSWVILGNPVYPFFAGVFGGHGFESQAGKHVGFGKDWLSFLLFPWNVTMHPDRFGGEIIGPLYLMLAPLALLKPEKTSRTGVILGAFTSLTLIFLFTQSQHARFALSVLPVLAVGAGVGLDKAVSAGGLLKKTVLLVFSCVMLAHGFIYVYRTHKVLAVVSGRVNVEKYLSEHERSYQGHRYLREHLKEGQSVFNAAESRVFYGPKSAVIISDGQPLRESLTRRGVSLRDFLGREQFDMLWLSAGSDSDILAFARAGGYVQDYAYSFTEEPATYEYLFFKKVS